MGAPERSARKPLVIAPGHDFENRGSEEMRIYQHQFAGWL